MTNGEPLPNKNWSGNPHTEITLSTWHWQNVSKWKKQKSYHSTARTKTINPWTHFWRSEYHHNLNSNAHQKAKSRTKLPPSQITSPEAKNKVSALVKSNVEAPGYLALPKPTWPQCNRLDADFIQPENINALDQNNAPWDRCCTAREKEACDPHKVKT